MPISPNVYTKEETENTRIGDYHGTRSPERTEAEASCDLAE